MTQPRRDLDVCFNPFRIDLFSDRFHGGLAWIRAWCNIVRMKNKTSLKTEPTRSMKKRRKKKNGGKDSARNKPFFFFFFFFPKFLSAKLRCLIGQSFLNLIEWINLQNDSEKSDWLSSSSEWDTMEF